MARVTGVGGGLRSGENRRGCGRAVGGVCRRCRAAQGVELAGWDLRERGIRQVMDAQGRMAGRGRCPVLLGLARPRGGVDGAAAGLAEELQGRAADGGIRLSPGPRLLLLQRGERGRGGGCLGAHRAGWQGVQGHARTAASAVTGAARGLGHCE